MTPAFPFLRRPGALRERSFDLLVIGGGIYGAWVACDAAQRGLSVALVEKYDWGGGTSSASSKLIHGGLRYLENYQLEFVRHALRERRRLRRIAPHLVRPLDFIMPLWKGPRASSFTLSAGLAIYDLLGAGRGSVGRHRQYRAPALLSEFPFLDPQNLQAGFRYGDCQTDDARMVLTVAAAAQAQGAVCVNRMAAERLLEGEGGVRGARLRDQETQESFELRARVTINAAGSWAPSLMGDAAPPLRLVQGTHLVMPAIPGCQEAFLLTARDGRVFFVIPWYGRTLVGTTEREVASPDQAQPTVDETRYLLDGLRNGLPGLRWTEKDVIARFCGLRTLQPAEYGSFSQITREAVIVKPKPRLVTYVGGSFTTARRDASHIVDAAYWQMSETPRPCLTRETSLPGTPAEPFEQWQRGAVAQLGEAGIDEEAAQSLSLRHGTNISLLLQLMEQRPELRARIHPEWPFLMAEVVHALQSEMARDIDDVLRRRLPLDLLLPDDDWRERVGNLIGRYRTTV
ncbi:glycerol-3-phosphate dehydrogenase/oxidase [Solimonas sp. SE-A11]|uniref:glycerol-3-phosphate dehydrogenase/oxidase n=1 Tax=Solimonas sp. SE-A11 TaxID=3054954 RepID=UPI00259CD03F|nr:glycerol-3-phosphate dehydrogenase/oxidase [Solimonas sp. SE-A11]MDM4769144.1 glycerol-3-phosphate dehydrogenase/oxidase [Solimonas sp. SE-A11]